jgi:exonuclease I
MNDPFQYMDPENSERLRNYRIAQIPTTLGEREYKRRWEHECRAHLSRIHREPSQSDIDKEANEFRAESERVEAWSRRVDAKFAMVDRLMALEDKPEFIGYGI